MKAFDYSNEKYLIGHLFLDSMRSNLSAVYQIDAATGKSKTNATVLRESVQLARCLRCFGSQHGDVVALSGRNHLELDIAYHAAILNGMPVAGMDPMFKYPEIKSHFKTSLPKIAFCEKVSLDNHLRVIKELGLNTKVICFDNEEHSLKQFIEQYDDGKEDENFEPLEIDADKVYAWLVSTGGTSGNLKLAAIKHRSFMVKMIGLQEMVVRGERSVENKTALHLSPVQWISSYFTTLSFPAMNLTKVTTSAQPTAEHVIDIINKYKPTSGVLSPSLIRGILNCKKQCDLTCFNNITAAGSKFEKELNMKLRKKMRSGATITELYGQTENIGPVLVPNPTGPLSNCGRANDSWHSVKLVDPETGIKITEPFVKGEIWTKGFSFTEYYNNPVETLKAFTEDGWYRTGDILYKDKGDNYYFVERISMLIKYRNYHVTPAELEALILDHPGVSDACVTSIPHEEDGQHAVACVVRKPGSDITAQDIKNIVTDKLSESQHLHGGVVFMDQLPLTSAGKLSRGKLKEIILTAHRE